MNHKELERLNAFHQNGLLTDEEFEQEKQRVRSEATQPKLFGLSESSYLAGLHFLLFVPTLGWILSVLACLIRRDHSTLVNQQGKYIVNWLISSTLYSYLLTYILTGNLAWAGMGNIKISTSPLFSGLSWSINMIPLVIMTVLSMVFPIIGGIKAIRGQAWKYPISIPFFK